MRSRLRTLLAAGLGVAVMGLAALASANTELVPSSRLVVPYYDTSVGRNTWLFLTNASVPAAAVPQNVGVHLEFYSETCNTQSTYDWLSIGDIDQLGINALVPVSFVRGWIDIDVRGLNPGIGPGGVAPALAVASPCNMAFGAPISIINTSCQFNSVMGTVLITDAVANFAFAYPATSYQGRSTAAVLPPPLPPGGAGVPGGSIVTRLGAGVAAVWSGRYEPLPWNVYVPVFLAEGGALGSQAYLAVAGPADGNWDMSGNGEAPGQPIGQAPAGALVSLAGDVYDGCEQSRNRNFSGHYIYTKFDNLATLNVPAQPWNTAAFPAPCGAWPSVDVDSGSLSALGWVTLTNGSLACDNRTPGTLATSCPAYAPGFAGPIGPGVPAPVFPVAGAGTGQRRGVTGILFQNTTVGSQQGDTTRLWGNPRPWGVFQCNLAPGFPTAAVGIAGPAWTNGCFYSDVNILPHTELALP